MQTVMHIDLFFFSSRDSYTPKKSANWTANIDMKLLRALSKAQFK